VGKLDGRVVLVTGGARGQGAREAQLFAREGASVVVADVLDDPGREVAAQLGEQARFIHLDVTSETDWAAAVDFAAGQFGHLDGLVNNAGVGSGGAITDTSPEEFWRVIRINQVGVFLGMRAAIPAMIAAGGGTIVNTASTSGLVGIAGTGAYTASKHAVIAMTRVAALELGPLHIRVNAVAPGGVDTPMNAAVASDMEITAGADPHAKLPLGRIGRPEEIAKVALFLTSDDSSYSTGAVHVADGGMLAGLIEF
jgi:3alpha(or 20beta)-hydroxysteroid dehydrogenase